LRRRAIPRPTSESTQAGSKRSDTLKSAVALCTFPSLPEQVSEFVLWY